MCANALGVFTFAGDPTRLVPVLGVVANFINGYRMGRDTARGLLRGLHLDRLLALISTDFHESNLAELASRDGCIQFADTDFLRTTASWANDALNYATYEWHWRFEP